MHDHATDGGRSTFEAKASARELRLHLDNAHDERTSGLDFPHLAELHRKAHKDARLAEIESAADLSAEGLAAAPPAVAQSILAEALYLTDPAGMAYLAEAVDPRHMPAAGPLYRLTAQVSPAESVDILEATRASLAATRTYLDAHQWGHQHPFGSPAEVEPRPAGRTTSAGAPLGGEERPAVVDLMAALEASLAAVKADRSDS